MMLEMLGENFKGRSLPCVSDRCNWDFRTHGKYEILSAWRLHRRLNCEDIKFKEILLFSIFYLLCRATEVIWVEGKAKTKKEVSVSKFWSVSDGI